MIRREIDLLVASYRSELSYIAIVEEYEVANPEDLLESSISVLGSASGIHHSLLILGYPCKEEQFYWAYKITDGKVRRV
jgi:hypothetical protein